MGKDLALALFCVVTITGLVFVLIFSALQSNLEQMERDGELDGHETPVEECVEFDSDGRSVVNYDC